MRFCVVISCCVLFLLASGPIASALANEKQADSAEVVSSGEDEKTVSWGADLRASMTH